MGYAIRQGNTVEALLFLMVSSADHVTGKVGLVPGVSLTVTLSKNGGAFAAPAGAVSELANGWYRVAANATDANTVGPLVLHAVGTDSDPCDETYDVLPVAAAPAAEVSTDATRGAVEDRLVLGGDPAPGAELAFVKLFLRVSTDADDALITKLILASKRAADDFLESDLAEDVPTITLSACAAGDMVEVDDQAYTAAAVGDDSEREFAVGATDADTAHNLAALLNSQVKDYLGEPYGVPGIVATHEGAVVSINLRRTRVMPPHIESNSDHLACTIVRTNRTIPEEVAQGCLRMIARLYEQRTDQVGSESVDGLGSADWTAPPESLRLWQPYRVYPGV